MLHSPKSVLIGNLWTSRGLVRGCALTCLRSGHSHEDVDQLFGSLSTFLFRRGQKAEVPEDFRVLIATFLGELHRPFEKGRYSLRLEQTRPWMLSCVTATFFCFLSSIDSDRLGFCLACVPFGLPGKVSLKLGFPFS